MQTWFRTVMAVYFVSSLYYTQPRSIISSNNQRGTVKASKLSGLSPIDEKSAILSIDTNKLSTRIRRPRKPIKVRKNLLLASPMMKSKRATDMMEENAEYDDYGRHLLSENLERRNPKRKKKKFRRKMKRKKCKKKYCQPVKGIGKEWEVGTGNAENGKELNSNIKADLSENDDNVPVASHTKEEEESTTATYFDNNAKNINSMRLSMESSAKQLQKQGNQLDSAYHNLKKTDKQFKNAKIVTGLEFKYEDIFNEEPESERQNFASEPQQSFYNEVMREDSESDGEEDNFSLILNDDGMEHEEEKNEQGDLINRKRSHKHIAEADCTDDPLRNGEKDDLSGQEGAIGEQSFGEDAIIENKFRGENSFSTEISIIVGNFDKANAYIENIGNGNDVDDNMKDQNGKDGEDCAEEKDNKSGKLHGHPNGKNYKNSKHQKEKISHKNHQSKPNKNSKLHHVNNEGKSQHQKEKISHKNHEGKNNKNSKVHHVKNEGNSHHRKDKISNQSHQHKNNKNDCADEVPKIPLKDHKNDKNHDIKDQEPDKSFPDQNDQIQSVSDCTDEPSDDHNVQNYENTDHDHKGKTYDTTSDYQNDKNINEHSEYDCTDPAHKGFKDQQHDYGTEDDGEQMESDADENYFLKELDSFNPLTDYTVNYDKQVNGFSIDLTVSPLAARRRKMVDDEWMPDINANFGPEQPEIEYYNTGVNEDNRNSEDTSYSDYANYDVPSSFEDSKSDSVDYRELEYMYNPNLDYDYPIGYGRHGNREVQMSEYFNQDTKHKSHTTTTSTQQNTNIGQDLQLYKEELHKEMHRQQMEGQLVPININNCENTSVEEHTLLDSDETTLEVTSQEITEAESCILHHGGGDDDQCEIDFHEPSTAVPATTVTTEEPCQFHKEKKPEHFISLKEVEQMIRPRLDNSIVTLGFIKLDIDSIYLHRVFHMFYYEVIIMDIGSLTSSENRTAYYQDFNRNLCGVLSQLLLVLSENNKPEIIRRNYFLRRIQEIVHIHRNQEFPDISILPQENDIYVGHCIKYTTYETLWLHPTHRINVNSGPLNIPNEDEWGKKRCFEFFERADKHVAPEDDNEGINIAPPKIVENNQVKFRGPKHYSEYELYRKHKLLTYYQCMMAKINSIPNRPERLCYFSQFHRRFLLFIRRYRKKLGRKPWHKIESAFKWFEHRKSDSRLGQSVSHWEVDRSRLVKLVEEILSESNLIYTILSKLMKPLQWKSLKGMSKQKLVALFGCIFLMLLLTIISGFYLQVALKRRMKVATEARKMSSQKPLDLKQTHRQIPR